MSDLPPPPPPVGPPGGALPPPPPSYVQPGYGYPAHAYSMVPARTTNGLAIASLVCGVAGFAVCGLISIAAIPLGLIALRQIRDSDGQEEGRGFAIAGISIGGALLAIAVLAIGIIIVIAATTEPSDPYDDEPYQPTTTFSVPG